VNGEHYAGAERVQDLLAAELPKFGFEVGFACVKPDQFPRVRHRVDGLLVEPACVSSLALAIEEIVAGDTMDYLTLSKNAHNRHAELFSAQAMTRSMADVYRTIL